MAGGSFYAGPAIEAHFGLGTAAVADEVRVCFPNGITAVRTAVAADVRIRVLESEGTATGCR